MPNSLVLIQLRLASCPCRPHGNGILLGQWHTVKTGQARLCSCSWCTACRRPWCVKLFFSSSFFSVVCIFCVLARASFCVGVEQFVSFSCCLRGLWGGVGGQGGGINVKLRLLSCFFGRKFWEHPGLFCGGCRVGSFLVSAQCERHGCVCV